MIDIEAVRQIALNLGGVTEEPHFDKSSFRVKKTNLFNFVETAAPDNGAAVIK